MDGILLVDKPEGLTSAEVVRRVKRWTKSKTGHLGTLDPFASGVLPLCLGEGTKIAAFLNQADKEYTGVVRLGARTDTGDLTGTVVADAAVPEDLSAARLAAVAASFLGAQMQTPPMYSAIKRDGQPLYRLARQGVEVEREPRAVRFDVCAVEAAGAAELRFRVACSKGTYVRVWAEDFASRLGTLGHLSVLRRTRFGPFGIERAHRLEEVEQAAESCLLPLRVALADVAEIDLSAAQAQRAVQGFEPLLARLAWPPQAGDVAKLIDPLGRLAAIIVREAGGAARYGRVFATPVA